MASSTPSARRTVAGCSLRRTRLKKVAAWSKTLHAAWSAAHGGADVLTRLDARLAQTCAKDGCQNALKT